MRRLTPVTIVCGPPGAGKSTYVRARKSINDLVLDVDELFRALTLLDGSQKPQCILLFALEARDAVIRLLQRGVLGPDRAWLIMCGEDNEARARLAESLCAQVVILSVAAGECRARMIAQGRPAWHVAEVSAVAERWHKRFRPRAGEIFADGVGREIGLDGWPLNDAAQH
jgi:hypothetical protein